jgi:aspartyl/asparaginyl-tRNA synthetase
MADLPLTRIVELFSSPDSFYDKSIKVCGAIHFERKAKKGTMIFIDLYDGSIQKRLSVVVERSDDHDVKRTPSELFDSFLPGCSTGATCKLYGYLIKCPEEREQEFELVVTHPVIIGTVPKTLPGASTAEYEIQKSNMYHLGYLRTIPHLRFRSMLTSTLMTIRSTLMMEITDFMRSKGVKWLDPNILTTSDCEGGGEAFLCTTLIDPEKTVDEIAESLRKPFKAPKADDLETGHLELEVKEGEEESKVDAATAEHEAQLIDFSKDMFCKPSYLTVSSQLGLEPIACAMGDVFTDNKSFRAEHSKTFKHVSEFKHIEYEGAYIDLADLLDFTEEFVKTMFSKTLEKHVDDFEFLHETFVSIEKGKIERELHAEFEELFKTRPDSLSGDKYIDAIIQKVVELFDGDTETAESVDSIAVSEFHEVIEGNYKKGKWLAFKGKIMKCIYAKYLAKYYIKRSDEIVRLISKPFTRIKYADAIKVIEEDSASGLTDLPPLPHGEDIGSDYEKYLTKKFDGFVFVTHWPFACKAFYMRRDRSDMDYVENFDLLAPFVGELFGGSSREEDHDLLLESMVVKGIPIDPLQWYLDIRKKGTIPHGGWGLGFARAVVLLTGAPSIKDIIPYPVSYQSLDY